MFASTREEIVIFYFSRNISRNIEVKYIFNFKAFLFVLDTFYISCLSDFNRSTLNKQIGSGKHPLNTAFYVNL